MDYKELKILDFSEGIRSSEVMNNDLALQGQIERERLSIAGHGINYGLDIRLADNNPFVLEVDNGTVVDFDGKERYVNGATIDIELPVLNIRQEKVYSNADGAIELTNIPYADNRLYPSEYCESDEYGITAYYEDEPSINLNISKISGKTIITNSSDPTRAIIVVYNVAFDRVDTIYINNNNEICFSSSINSTTPSKTRNNDCKYILGYVRVYSFHVDEETKKIKATAELIDKFNHRRTVYTDSKQNLYLCGIPFDSLLQIYMSEPAEAKEGMMWYDSTINKLKVWRRTDNFMFTDTYTYTSVNNDNPQYFNTSVGYKEGQLSVYRYTSDTRKWLRLGDEQVEFFTDLLPGENETTESLQFRILPKLNIGDKIRYTINRYDGSYNWITINDSSFIPVTEYKIWAPNSDETTLVHYMPGLEIEEMPIDRPKHDLKHFLFKAEELNLRFEPYKNNLNIMIDQIPLHRDQFVEITVTDILKSDELLNLALHYGYTREDLQDIDTSCGIGLGFKLVNELDRPGFIEVNVTQRVNDSIIKNKFQRTATFSKSDTVTYKSSEIDDDGNYEVVTLIPYCKDEEQLEVYINGIRLKKSEINEVANIEGIKGARCHCFRIIPAKLKMKDGDEITYKINVNVYSYDHLTSAIEQSKEGLEQKVCNLETEIKLLKEQIKELLAN